MAKATDIRETPQDFFDQMNAAYGPFDLDACANERNSKCGQAYFGPRSDFAEDALTVRWTDHGDRFWMNPPYSEIPQWLGKAMQEVRRDRRVRVACLLPSNTSAHWWHRFIWDNKQQAWRRHVRHIYFHPRRLTFAPHQVNAMWPSVVVVLGQPS